VPKRNDQRRKTYARIVDAAVDLLIEKGYAATTALGVQHRVGISRGALLHHFPTSAALSAATIRRLIEMNFEAIREELTVVDPDLDPVQRAVEVGYRASRRPSFAASMELWAAARADKWLREALVFEERRALDRFRNTADEVFGPDVMRRPGYRELLELTIQLFRGLTVSASLGDGAGHDKLIKTWVAMMQSALDDPSFAAAMPSS
jgi:AcrR family transcriptional regulator